MTKDKMENIIVGALAGMAFGVIASILMTLLNVI